MISREAEVEIGTGDDVLGAMLELSVDPGFAGNGNAFTAASDVDYYGQPATVDEVRSVRVYDDVLSAYREPTPAERTRVDAWLESKAGLKWQQQEAAEAVEADAEDRDADPYDDEGW